MRKIRANVVQELQSIISQMASQENVAFDTWFWWNLDEKGKWVEGLETADQIILSDIYQIIKSKDIDRKLGLKIIHSLSELHAELKHILYEKNHNSASKEYANIVQATQTIRQILEKLSEKETYTLLDTSKTAQKLVSSIKPHLTMDKPPWLLLQGLLYHYVTTQYSFEKVKEDLQNPQMKAHHEAYEKLRQQVSKICRENGMIIDTSNGWFNIQTEPSITAIGLSHKIYVSIEQKSIYTMLQHFNNLTIAL
jgi:hypothetical protein